MRESTEFFLTVVDYAMAVGVVVLVVGAIATVGIMIWAAATADKGR